MALVPIGVGSRNDYLYRLGCSLRAKGLGEAAIIAALLAENGERCVPPLPPDEVRATACSAARKPPGLSPEYERRRGAARAPDRDADGPRDGAPGIPPREAAPKGRPALKVVGGTEHDARPVVQIRDGELPAAVDATEAYLLGAGVDIYQHGTRLVRVGRWDGQEGPVRRPRGSGVLVDISPEWLVDQCSRTIRYTRWDRRMDAERPIDCPSKVASTVLARAGSWRFRWLAGFCDAPTLDLSGRLVEAPGYDAGSGLYLAYPPPLEPLGPMSRDLARGAGELLYEAVSTFPFVSDHDASACLALIMTALLRRVLPAAPLGGVSASTPGTGKSKLVDVVSAIATGRAASVVAIGATPEELEKRLDAVLLQGDALCCFDNVDRAIKSDVLCQAATQGAKAIRVMGLSKIVEAPTNVFICLTGNNLTLVGDLVRRVVLCNLEAGCERPELREFGRDAVDYVLERRSELIAAALTISKAYLEAGCPRVDAPPFGSFEVWDRMVRFPLLWADWPDPLVPAELLRDQDHELTGLRDLLAAWLKIHPEPCSAAELSELIRSRAPLMGDGWAPQFPELTEAAVQVMGDLGRWGPRELGYRLRGIQGRLLGGLRVVRLAGKDSAKLRTWRVESVGARRA